MTFLCIPYPSKNGRPKHNYHKARNTSCSDGWLRVAIQIIFGTLIVTSFVLIVRMAIGNAGRVVEPPHPRCSINNCRVICHDAPFYGEYEEDVINAASEANVHCESIELKLNRPIFSNSEISENFLSRVRVNVRELTIIGGNTRHIAPHTFISPFGNNIRTLILADIVISLWDNDMLMGLTNLKKLVVDNCFIGKVRNGALLAVDDTLEFLDIKASNTWEPRNFTGSINSDLAQLHVVDFSSNNFFDILKNTSFTKLKQCKILFLNSCRIGVIGLGTFDYLDNLEVLYLNDNLLVTIPVGLFDRLLSIRPRIALQENFWHCDCSVNDLRTIFNNGLLIIDPICRFPDAVKGFTFSEFDGYCEKHGKPIEGMILPDFSNDTHLLYPCLNVSRVFYIDAACHERNSSSTLFTTESIEQPRCMLHRINKKELEPTVIDVNDDQFENNDWIKPVYSIQSKHYSMLEIASAEQHGLGLVWYQSACSNQMSCVDFIPNTLKVYNVNAGVIYIFCPFNLTSGTVLHKKCVAFNLDFFERNVTCNTCNHDAVILYICISIGCLISGAIIVYAIIQRNPTLLKGNKRVIFVKHKSIEALILPPQLPKRNKSLDNQNAVTKHVYERQKIFLVPDNLDRLSPQNFIRSTSMRSSESNDASYISPLQPTEEQLNEWRSNQIIKFENPQKTESDASSFSSIYEQQSLPYYTYHTTERIYEVPKQY